MFALLCWQLTLKHESHRHRFGCFNHFYYLEIHIRLLLITIIPMN